VSILRPEVLFLRRFLFFALFSVVIIIYLIICVGHLLKSKYDKLARFRRSSDHSSLKRLYLLQGTMTTCRSRSCLACERCEHSRPRLAPSLDSNTICFSGLFSTIFLMVDVKSSRIECEEFVVAEASREAFAASNVSSAATLSFRKALWMVAPFTLALTIVSTSTFATACWEAYCKWIALSRWRPAAL
jgi:hypothetical protein